MGVAVEVACGSAGTKRKYNRNNLIEIENINLIENEAIARKTEYKNYINNTNKS